MSGGVSGIPYELTSRRLESVFAGICARDGSRIAIRGQDRSLSYAELDRESNRLAHALRRALAPEPSVPVALLLHDRILQVIAILGALKAGCPYAPLDAGDPPARLNGMAADLGAGLVISEAGTAGVARALAVRHLDLDDLDERLPSSPPEPLADPDAAAYIMYTSGSTGRPKGVVQSHRTVLHHVLKYSALLGITADDRIAWLASHVYAASVSDIFPALLNGACLLPYPLMQAGTGKLPGWLESEEVTIYHSVPTVFRRMVEKIESPLRLPRLRILRLAGEPVRRSDAQSFRRLFPAHTRFLCSLGSTEMNLIRALFVGDDTDLTGGMVPVGYAVADTEVLVLDPENRVLPRGQVGELAIRSRYLTPGYWRQPELNARAFRADPEDPGLRTFRNGDLARLRADGCLELLGRADDQLKFRGVRVQPEEIEGAIVAGGHARDAVVVAREDGRGRAMLVAFLLGNAAGDDGRGLRAALGAQLPKHLVPGEFVYLDAFPLLPTGKVNRRALARTGPVRSSAG